MLARPKSGQNHFVAPIENDPITCIEYDAARGYAIVGSMSGRIAAYLVNFDESDKPKDQAVVPESKAIDGAPAGPVRVISSSQQGRLEVTCTILAPKSDESIRSIHLDKQRILAIVGDVQVKEWDSISHAVRVRPFRRAHHYGICTNSYTLCAGPRVLIMTTGSRDSQYFDLSDEARAHDLFPTIVRCGLPGRTIPVAFDGTRVVWVERIPSVGRSVKVQDLTTVPPTTLAEMSFTRPNKFYWGFQVSGSRIAYVTNHSIIKIWELNNKEKFLFKFTAHKSQVLAFIFRDEGRELITLGDDNKIKMWRDGVLVRKLIRINGKFHSGVPYILKRFGDWIFYSADDGVFSIHL